MNNSNKFAITPGTDPGVICKWEGIGKVLGYGHDTEEVFEEWYQFNKDRIAFRTGEEHFC
jgi:hypothetical protein